MSGFSAQWLALREPVDLRSRDAALAAEVARRFSRHPHVNVIDLGCGTGANLRVLAPLLGAEQSWQLVDYDPLLLAAASERLAAWADTARAAAEGLELTKAGRHIKVTFRNADMARDLPNILAPPVELITASALFDLFSPAAIERLAGIVAHHRAVLYTVLTYDGRIGSEPASASDQAVIAAFNAHQRRDKGFGPAAGPTAPAVLAECFSRAGYEVREGQSPWRLGAADGGLMAALVTGVLDAVRESGELAESVIEEWSARGHRTAVVGHIDTLALPRGS